MLKNIYTQTHNFKTMLQDHYLNLTLLLSGIDKDFIDSHSPPPKTTESEGLYPISENLVEDYHKRQIIDLEKSECFLLLEIMLNKMKRILLMYWESTEKSKYCLS